MSADAVAFKPGVAYIKPEFLLRQASRDEGNATITNTVTATSTAAVVAADAPPSDAEGVTGNGVKRHLDSSDEAAAPQHKRQKGQNKHRPRLVKEPRSLKLCRNVWAMTREDLAKVLPSAAASAATTPDTTTMKTTLTSDTTTTITTPTTDMTTTMTTSTADTEAVAVVGASTETRSVSNECEAAPSETIQSNGCVVDGAAAATPTTQTSPLKLHKHGAMSGNGERSTGETPSVGLNDGMSVGETPSVVVNGGESTDNTQPMVVDDGNASPVDPAMCRLLCNNPGCVYSHDVTAFLARKPADIATDCPNFATFGFCQYGLTCRFGSGHVSGGFNVVDEQRREVEAKLQHVTNTLPKPAMQELRKRCYAFTKVKAALQAAKEQQREEITRTKQQQQDKYEREKAEQQKTEQQKAEEKEVKCDETVDKEAVVDVEKARQEAEQPGQREQQHGTVTAATELPAATAAEEKRVGPAPEEDLIRLRPSEKKKVVWRDQLYLAPLTTLGNLPFRRICRRLGADITCGEMAVATCLLQAKPSEWALVKRHHTEAVFGVQLCGSNADAMVRCAEVLADHADMDFVDINMGCPIDFIYTKGAGSALMRRTDALQLMVRGMSAVLPCPVTLKMRTAIHLGGKVAHTIIPSCRGWGASMITVHGRSREQRYLKEADWAYIEECAAVAAPLPLFGSGDVLTYEDYNRHRRHGAGVAGVMIGRGALIKPWLFTEIKEQRHWDISSHERLEILNEFVHNGLEHWGSDSEGVEKTRRFLLEWLSFLHRYIPLGLLQRPPQTMNQKPPPYTGRDHLETLMASKNVQDWITISEMLLGPVPDSFLFLPKHKANSWA